jgi:hypothetical protein
VRETRRIIAANSLAWLGAGAGLCFVSGAVAWDLLSNAAVLPAVLASVGVVAAARMAAIRNLARTDAWLKVLILYSALHPTVYALLRMFVPGVPTWVYLAGPDILLLGLFALALTRECVRPAFHFCLLDYSVLLWMATALTSAVVSGDAIAIVYGLRITYLPVALYWVVRLRLRQRLDACVALADHILRVGAGVAVVGLILYFVVPMDLLLPWYVENEFVVGYYQGIRRMDSILWTPAVFGSLMALCATLSAAFAAMDAPTRSRRLWCLVGVVVFTLCCLLSLSRGSWVAAVAGVGTVTVLTRKPRAIVVTIVAALVVATGVGAITSEETDSPWLRHALSIIVEPEFATGQIHRAWQRELALEDVARNPLGVGLGQTGHAAARLRGEEEVDRGVFDAWYLKTWQESGVPGIVAFVVFMAAFIVVAIQGILHVKDPKDRALVMGTAGAFIGFSFQGYGSNVWDFQMVAALFWALVAAVANVVGNQRLAGARRAP